ncbi:hypothetical protein D1007_34043 [Hordeum vulgare]|nr:hypothetical protein D1007_34043 [Hordeum vulgare]
MLDPKYKDMIYFNSGGRGHHVGNCVKPKSCFICQQNHNVNNCAAWSKIQPTAAFLGSGARGLGFYHVDVPVANESNWLSFQNCAVVNIIKGDVGKTLLLNLLTSTFCKAKHWTWHIEKLSHKTFLTRFPPWKKVEDPIELPGFCLPQDVVDKMTEWKGNARVKIACRDPTKISFERLIEMKKKLYVLGFIVEGFEQAGCVDYLIDIDTEDEDGDGGGAKEGHKETKEEPSKDELNDDLIDDDTDIDELDRANITTQRKTYGSDDEIPSQDVHEGVGASTPSTCSMLPDLSRVGGLVLAVSNGGNMDIRVSTPKGMSYDMEMEKEKSKNME